MPEDSFNGKMRRGKVWPHLHALQEKYGTLLGALADKRLRVDLRDPSKVMAGIWVLGDWWRALGTDRQLGLSPRRCQPVRRASGDECPESCRLLQLTRATRSRAWRA